MTLPLEQLRKLTRQSLVAMLAGVVVCAVVAWSEPQRLLAALLFAFLACWLASVGGMGLLALGNLTGGRWAAAGRPFYLAAMQNIWPMALVFLVLAAFPQHIYPWAGESPPALPPAKAAYLEIGFFRQRAAGYFVVWLALTPLLRMVSRSNILPASTPAMRRVGAIALVLLVPTVTFAAFDWGMSLEPEWYSSIYGALLSAGGVLAAHALAVCGATTVGENAIARALRAAGYSEVDAVSNDQLQATSPVKAENPLADVYNDLGNLLLAFLMVNTYFALSQFLIIWSGNLPSEITWYLRRQQGGWQWFALGLVLLHFALPFSLLLSREAKRSPQTLRRVAWLLLAMFAAHLYWIIVPAFTAGGASQHVLNLAALAAVSGAWLAAFAWNVDRYFVREELAIA